MADTAKQFTKPAPLADYALTEEVAERYGVGTVTVRRWARSGKVPSVKVGKRFYFKIEDVDRALLEKGGDDGR
ncbi:helix-turn-helix domain-containing protein [Paratractidigestivibacter sp.]|uniref:helix-turn-helix domain-containing protein n=1 Tax=Paratractidigestivibacter sp. TaxID=2847316 RepID=UPI002ABDD228|nr:helix-turn-helix domain-containing protein [Paratractidigestivibacter sp.]